MPILGADMSAGTLVAWRKKAGDTVKRGRHHRRGGDRQGADRRRGLHRRHDRADPRPAGRHGAHRDRRSRSSGRSRARRPLQRRHACRSRHALPSPVSAASRRLRLLPRPPPVERESPRSPGSSPPTWASISTTLHGTGPGGAITPRGHRARGGAACGSPAEAPRPALDRPAAAAADDRAPPWRAPSARSRTTTSAPPSTCSRALAWLAEENLERPVTDRLLYGVLLIKAVALALREVPELNSVWRGAEAVPSAAIHVGVADLAPGRGTRGAGAARHRPAEPGRSDAELPRSRAAALAPEDSGAPSCPTRRSP